MRYIGDERLPGRGFRRDRRLSAAEARYQADDDQGEHGQSEHEMPSLKAFADVAPFGIILPQQNRRINGGNQQDHDPVKSDRQGGKALTDIGWIHCEPHILNQF